MSEYYDKQSFGGGKKPPEKKEDGEISWVAVVLLFAIGLWPIALLYMGWRWLQGNGKESADEKLRRVQKKFDDAIDGALKGFAGGETAKKASATESAAAAKTAGKTTSRKRTGKKEKALKKISTLGAMGVFWQLLGAFFLLGAVGCLGEVGGDLAYLQTLKYCVEELIVGLNMLAAGGVMLCHGISTNRFAKRAKKYLAAVGSAEAMDIDLIARRVGCGYKRTVKDLKKMIDKGFFGDDAYLDLDMGYFLRFNSAAERQSVQEEAAPAAAPVSSVPKETEEGYSGILRDIRRANDRIADEELSAKIDKLEQITGQILLAVEKKPEKRAKMHTFFDYYLPTTQKLLNAYADFEETGVEGANMREAKERIELAMDSIVAGFAHQLDELYKADAMDVAADLKVMEAMLGRDTGGAAKDFGFDPTQQK